MLFLSTKSDHKFSLYIVYNEYHNTIPIFKYYVNGILFKQNTGVVSKKLLIANMDSIDNFFLYELNGNEISEKKEEVLKDIEEIKVKVTNEDKKDKYGNTNSKY